MFRLSSCTRPVSVSIGMTSTFAGAVIRNSHDGTAVRAMSRAPGRRAASSASSSMLREAWPKPWPEI
jgi:hypothetical protein